MKLFFSQQNPQRIISSLLVVWLSGFVFLFCCGTMEVQAKGEFCPLAKAKSHCDKAKNDDSAILLEQSGNETFDCCGFLPAVFDKTRKVEKNQQPANIINRVKVDRPQFFLVKSEYETHGIYHPPFLNQEKTFIVNCVFRI